MRSQPVYLPASPSSIYAQPPSFAHRLLRASRLSSKVIAFFLLLGLLLLYTLSSNSPAPSRHHVSNLAVNSTEWLDRGDRKCPDPFKPRPLVKKADIPLDFSHCSSLLIRSEELSAFLCPTSPNLSCNSFYVVIERIKKTEACSKWPLSKAPEYRKSMPLDHGPDLFTVLVTGSEHFAISKAIVS